MLEPSLLYTKIFFSGFITGIYLFIQSQQFPLLTLHVNSVWILFQS